MTGKPGTCLVAWCDAEALEGAVFCGSLGNRHLTDNWLGRLRLLSDGTYAHTVGPAPRLEPEWLRRSRAQAHGLAKDMGRA